MYLQLIFEGWEVRVGKLYAKEIDFVAVKDGKTRYVQVSDQIFDEETRKRELAPLRSISDNYEKQLVVKREDRSYDIDGIEVLAARDFLLGASK